MCKGYYSPKIKEDYIPVLYLIAKEQKIPMTKLVNRMIENQIDLLIERRQREKGGDQQRRTYRHFWWGQKSNLTAGITPLSATLLPTPLSSSA